MGFNRIMCQIPMGIGLIQVFLRLLGQGVMGKIMGCLVLQFKDLLMGALSK